MVVVGMASMPSRSPIMPDVVRSLLRQDVDRFHLYLNDYPPDYEIPTEDERLIIHRSQDCIGNIGVAGKHYGQEAYRSSYRFTCDDDIWYPPDYISKTIGFAEGFDRKAVVAYHASNVFSPCQSYYRDRVGRLSFAMEHNRFSFRNVPGTGTMCYHSDLLNVKVEDIKGPLHDDISVACLLQKMETPIVSPKRSANWMRDVCVNDRDSASRSASIDDSLETAMVNSIQEWKVFQCQPAWKKA